MYETYILTLAGIVLILLILVGLIFKFFSYIKRQDERNKQTYLFVETMLKMQNDLLAKLIDARLKVEPELINQTVEQTKEVSPPEEKITLNLLNETLNDKEIKPKEESDKKVLDEQVIDKTIIDHHHPTEVILLDNSKVKLFTLDQFNDNLRNLNNENIINKWKEYLLKFPKFDDDSLQFSLDLFEHLSYLRYTQLNSKTTKLILTQLPNGDEIKYLTVNYLSLFQSNQTDQSNLNNNGVITYLNNRRRI